MTPAVSVDPLFPPHPTSITLPVKKIIISQIIKINKKYLIWDRNGNKKKL